MLGEAVKLAQELLAAMRHLTREIERHRQELEKRRT